MAGAAAGGPWHSQPRADAPASLDRPSSQNPAFPIVALQLSQSYISLLVIPFIPLLQPSLLSRGAYSSLSSTATTSSLTSRPLDDNAYSVDKHRKASKEPFWLLRSTASFLQLKRSVTYHQLGSQQEKCTTVLWQPHRRLHSHPLTPNNPLALVDT